MALFFDIAIVVISVWLFYKGYVKGLIMSLFTFISLIAGAWVSIHFSNVIASYLLEMFSVSSQWLIIISFAITFILMVIMVRLIGKLIEKVIKLAALGFLNRVFGGIFSLAKLFLVLIILFNYLDALDKQIAFIQPSFKLKSKLYMPLVDVSKEIYPALRDNFNQQNISL